MTKLAGVQIVRKVRVADCIGPARRSTAPLYPLFGQDERDEQDMILSILFFVELLIICPIVPCRLEAEPELLVRLFCQESVQQPGGESRTEVVGA